MVCTIFHCDAKVKNDAIIKRLRIAVTVLACVPAMAGYAGCSEKYYINNTPVLLYKIINWWYYCLPEESHQFCGSIVRCQTRGDIQIKYDSVKMTLRIDARKNFADLLSVFKECRPCRGPSYLKPTWLNEDYFGSGKFSAATGGRPAVNSFLFDHIDRPHAQKIQGVADTVGLELEGVICGLMNGRIALHHAGKLLKPCHMGPENENFPITLKIVNFQTEEILAELCVVFDNEDHNRPFEGETRAR